jgi:GNAT superfamily N-acetyltransferase
MPTIRLLQPSDSFDELTALLHRAYARLAAMGLNYTAVDQPPEVTAKRVRGGTCYVATEGDRIVGTIVVQPTYANNECSYLTRDGVACAMQFAVDPDQQGKGVGRALLEQAEQWARQEGFSELAMDTAEPATHLVSLYQRLGYTKVDVIQREGKVYRSIVLSKSLLENEHTGRVRTGV